MNFRVLDGDIYFSEEFIKLHEIREQFLQDAFNCVLNLREEFFNKFKTVEQLLKDGEAFGYEYLNAYILKAVEIVKGFGGAGLAQRGLTCRPAHTAPGSRTDVPGSALSEDRQTEGDG